MRSYDGAKIIKIFTLYMSQILVSIGMFEIIEKDIIQTFPKNVSLKIIIMTNLKIGNFLGETSDL